jgi:hypothetical protein
MFGLVFLSLSIYAPPLRGKPLSIRCVCFWFDEIKGKALSGIPFHKMQNKKPHARYPFSKQCKTQMQNKDTICKNENNEICFLEKSYVWDLCSIPFHQMQNEKPHVRYHFL